MSDWNDFFSSVIFSARAKTYKIYKEIQAYDLANRATLSVKSCKDVCSWSAIEASLKFCFSYGLTPLPLPPLAFRGGGF